MQIVIIVFTLSFYYFLLINTMPEIKSCGFICFDSSVATLGLATLCLIELSWGEEINRARQQIFISLEESESYPNMTNNSKRRILF